MTTPFPSASVCIGDLNTSARSQFRRSFRASAALLVVALLLGGCTTLLQDDFEADTVGALPLAQPDGAPNDLLEAAPGPGEIVVVDSLPITGEQSLRLRGPSGESTPAVILHAEPIPNADVNEPVYVFWQLRLSSGARARVEIVIDFEHLVLRVDMEDGLIFINGNSIGHYTQGAVQRFQVGLRPDTDTYNLTVSGGTDVRGTVSGALSEADAFPGNHVAVVFRLPNAEGAQDLWIDSVYVSQ
ncbi:MAG TPA: hypothetical protein VGD81_05150 [Opitutaceae bacterium]